MPFALAQLNPTIGDVTGNTTRIIEAIDEARQQGATVLVTPELAVLGYPPRDLLFRLGVAEACEQAVERIAKHAGDLTVLVGSPRRGMGGGRPFRNSVFICHGGEVVATYDKRLFPGYDVFDEDRYFDPGHGPCVVEILGRRVGVVVCEDLWRAEDARVDRHYPIEPVRETVALGVDLLITLNASPFVLNKHVRHVKSLCAIAREHAVPVVSVNQVGANDDLIFDGRSCVIGADGSMLRALPGWKTCVETVDLLEATPIEWAAADPNQELWDALVLGVRDYCRKTGHTDVVLGLSGGIDSTLVAAIAAGAIGADHVHGLLMPSEFSSPGSLTDARDLAGRLGLLHVHEVPIRTSHDALRVGMKAALRERPTGVTDENLQARLRGVMLMAYANTKNLLLLSTSNKSEMAAGYTTLYGDMCGAIAPIGDLLKTQVYDLSRWINVHHALCGFDAPPIPQSSIDKPPSAELRPHQTDQDSLPPYDIFDSVITRIIDEEQSVKQVVDETGLDEDFVCNIACMIDRAEYKRFQAAVVLKVARRTFGPGRPYPIVMNDHRGGKC